MTTEDIMVTIPPALHNKVDSNTLDLIQDMYDDPDMCEAYRDNMISWNEVIDARVTLEQYVLAVKYVSLKMVKKKNKEAYALVFPDKVTDWINRNVPATHQDAYVSSYNTSRLVKALWERSMIAVHVFHHDTFNKAVRVQARLMNDESISPMARVKAADSLLTHLKPPETIHVNVEDNRGHTELDAIKEQISALVDKQSAAIESGTLSAKEVAETKLFDAVVDGEFEEVES